MKAIPSFYSILFSYCHVLNRGKKTCTFGFCGEEKKQTVFMKSHVYCGPLFFKSSAIFLFVLTASDE